MYSSLTKKTLIFIVILTILTSYLIPNTLTYANTDNSINDSLTLSVSQDVYGKPGETVYVNVNLENIPKEGICSANFAFLYDRDKLTYKKFIAGDRDTVPEDGELSVEDYGKEICCLYSSLNPQGMRDGIFFTMVFTISKNCSDSELYITLDPITPYNSKFYDSNDSQIPASFSPGKINVNHLVVSVPDVVGTKGQLVPVDIMLENIPIAGLSEAIIDLKYDKTKLKYNYFKGNADVGETDQKVTSTKDGIRIAYKSTKQNSYIQKDGILSTVNFLVDENCPDTTLDLSLSSLYDFKDSNYEVMPSSTLKNGHIIVKPYTPTSTVTPPISTISPPSSSTSIAPSTPGTLNTTATLPPAITPTPQISNNPGLMTSDTPVPAFVPTVTPSSASKVYNVTYGKSKIQDIINEASSGSTIIVSGGIYHENLIINNKSLIIKGGGKENTIIDGDGLSRPVVAFTQASDSSIQGFTISNGIRGIQIQGSDNVKISDCIINANQYEGISLSNSSSNNTVVKCKIVNNTTGIDLGDLNDQKNNSILNNKISSNIEFGVKGLQETSGTKVLKNEISSNGKYGILTGGSHWDIESNNIFSNKDTGIFLNSANQILIKSNRISRNQTGIAANGKDVSISNNILSDNISVNIKVEEGSKDLEVWNNSIMNSPILAQDHRKNTNWNKGTQGNYWSTYAGKDQNKDNIGDTPFIISKESNIQDSYPLILPIPGDEIPYVRLEDPSDIKGHWAEKQILKLYNANIISGYSDNTIKPDIYITRNEMVVLIAKSLKLKQEDTAELNFIDPIAVWVKDYLRSAISKGFIEGYDDGSFRGGNYITRAEALVMILKSKGIAITSDSSLNYSDSQFIPKWSKGYFLNASRLGYINGYPDNTIRPNGLVTRAEAFSLIDRIILEENKITK
jgi:parallel beta-helix repeat protein